MVPNFLYSKAISKTFKNSCNWHATSIFLFEFHETDVSNMHIFSVVPSVVNENSKTCCFFNANIVEWANIPAITS
jgi:hypothetical protein